MSIDVDLNLKDLLAKSKKIFWGGNSPPFSRMYADERIFSHQNDYRLPCDYHETFDLVCLNEVDLGSIKPWPIVIDEALRLLSPQGVLLVRMTDSPLLSVYALKNQLFSWGQTTILFDHKFSDGSYLFAIKNERTERRGYSNEINVSFCVITDGKRKLQLDRLVSSLQSLVTDENQNIELIICGPCELDISEYQEELKVALVPEPLSFRDRGWITRKKNLLVKSARYENIVIVHDRYFFPHDFLQRLGEFGFDFEVMSCKQISENGERMPDWVALGDAWQWTAPGMLTYGDWSPYIYINGGLIIAKTKILKAHPWNELLFWMQAEDVELTRRLQSSGCVPRFATKAKAYTDLLRRGSIEVMEAIPRSHLNYWLPSPPAWGDSKKVTPCVPLGSILDLVGGELEYFSNQGVFIGDEWNISSNGIALNGSQGVIAFRLAFHPYRDLPLEILLDRPELVDAIYVNGVLATKMEKLANRLKFVCSVDAFQFSTTLRLSIKSSSSILLTSIQISGGSVFSIISHSQKMFLKSFKNFYLRLFSFLYKHARQNKHARRAYQFFKHNEKLKNSPFVKHLYRKFRSVVGRVK